MPGKAAVAVIGLLSCSALLLIWLIFGSQIPFFAPRPAPTVTLTIHGGEISMAKFGFALEGKNMTSPGPTITVKLGDVVQITFKNIGGKMNQPHTFAVVTADNKLAFEGARVGTATEPIEVGKSGSATFVVDKTGEFTYICEVQGHRQHGQWGKFIVQP